MNYIGALLVLAFGIPMIIIIWGLAFLMIKDVRRK